VYNKAAYLLNKLEIGGKCKKRARKPQTSQQPVENEKPEVLLKMTMPFKTETVSMLEMSIRTSKDDPFLCVSVDSAIVVCTLL
jgi:hypothetical protein